MDLLAEAPEAPPAHDSSGGASAAYGGGQLGGQQGGQFGGHQGAQFGGQQGAQFGGQQGGQFGGQQGGQFGGQQGGPYGGQQGGFGGSSQPPGKLTAVTSSMYFLRHSDVLHAVQSEGYLKGCAICDSAMCVQNLENPVYQTQAQAYACNEICGFSCSSQLACRAPSIICITGLVCCTTAHAVSLSCRCTCISPVKCHTTLMAPSVTEVSAGKQLHSVCHT